MNCSFEIKDKKAITVEPNVEDKIVYTIVEDAIENKIDIVTNIIRIESNNDDTAGNTKIINPIKDMVTNEILKNISLL
jgi:hypothetical protein